MWIMPLDIFNDATILTLKQWTSLFPNNDFDIVFILIKTNVNLRFVYFQKRIEFYLSRYTWIFYQNSLRKQVLRTSQLVIRFNHIKLLVLHSNYLFVRWWCMEKWPHLWNSIEIVVKQENQTNRIRMWEIVSVGHRMRAKVQTNNNKNGFAHKEKCFHTTSLHHTIHQCGILLYGWLAVE